MKSGSDLIISSIVIFLDFSPFLPMADLNPAISICSGIQWPALKYGSIHSRRRILLLVLIVLIWSFVFLALLTRSFAISSLFISLPNFKISEQISLNDVPFNEITFVFEDSVHLLFLSVASIWFSEIEQTSHKPCVTIISGLMSLSLSVFIL